MSEISFSVLLPVYRKVLPKLFKKSLDSILNQSLLPNELIVIFDGPVHLNIKKYILKKKKKFKFIKLIIFKKNHGLGYVLKKTTLKVKNNYIARCDADDISLKNRFRDQINFLKKNKHIDVLSSNIIELNKNKKQIKKVPKLHEDIKKKIYFRNPINHSSVIIKKKILIKAGNYEEVNYFEDYFLWFKIINCGGKFHNIQKNHVIMNVDKDYYQRRSGLKYYLDYLYLLKKVRKKKIINNIQYILNIIIRFLVILTPIFFLSKIYKIFLRN